MDPNLRRTLVRIAAGIVVAAILIWLMMLLESVTTMLMVSFIFAYVLDPSVRRLDSWGLGRHLSAFLMLIFGFLVVTAVLLILVPKAFEEISAFSAEAPKYFSMIQGLIVQGAEKLNITLPQDSQDLLNLIAEKGRQYLPRMAAITTGVISVFFKSTIHILSTILFILLIPIITYYLLVSFPAIKAGVIDLIPPYIRPPVLVKLKEIDLVLSGFIRGQLTIALLLGILYTIGFLLIRIDLAVVLGVLSGLLWIIPYVGTLFGLIVGLAYGSCEIWGYIPRIVCYRLDCRGPIGRRLLFDSPNRRACCWLASGRVYDGPDSWREFVWFCGTFSGHTGHCSPKGAAINCNNGVSQFLFV